MSTAYTTLNFQPNDIQTIQRLIQSITQNIQRIAQNVSQIENMNMQIGTSKDSENLREKLLQIENSTNQLAKDTNKQLKELNNYVRTSSNLNPTAEERQFKIQKERLTNDLVKTLNKFQEVQKLTMQKQKESNERVKANMSQTTDSIQMDSFTNKSPDFGDEFKSEETKNQQAQIAIEQDVNLVQLKEREASLRRLENDIVDVNMIFKDLAVMVHDQGEVIDSIESNVENVQIRVTEANSSLESAKKNQQAARKKKFIFFMIIAAVLAVVLLIIILSVSLD